MVNCSAHGQPVGNRSMRRPERFTITAAIAISWVRRVRFVTAGCLVIELDQIPRLWANTEQASHAALA